MTHKSTSDILDDILQYLQVESVCVEVHRDSQRREWIRSQDGEWERVELFLGDLTSSRVSQSVVKATLGVQPYRVIPVDEATAEDSGVVWEAVGLE